MKKQARIFFCLLAAFALLGAALPAQAAKAIKVGIVDTYSGPPSTYTNDVRDAFKLVTDRTNAKGGIKGSQIEFVTRDDKFKVDLALSAAKELIMRENVDMLMGTINSAATLAVSDLAKKEKIPFLVTFSKSDKITGASGHRYVFSMNENTAMIGKAAAAGLAKKPWTKYWIAGDDYEYGHAVAEGIWNNLKKLKPAIQKINESWWKLGEPDFTPYITSILAAKPEAVIIATGGAGCVPFLKAAQATGFNKQVPFFMHTATELATLKPLGIEAPEGVLGTSNYHFFFPETAENKAFVEEFKKAYNRVPTVGALYGYLTGQFMAQALEKVGQMDREKFIDALAGMSVNSPVGKVTIRAYDHQVMLPMFMGVTKKVEGYDFLIAKDIVTISAEEAITPVEEVKKARGQ
ncbi:MAG: ABC transporter substrate-binding protein [Thermodesulfobacteriota bacterium]